MKIYNILPDGDSFRSFTFKEEFPFDYFNGRPLSSIWKPIEIKQKYKRLPNADIQSFDGIGSVINKRTKDILSLVLKDTVEFLPLNFYHPFYLLNVIHVLDVMDYSKSTPSYSYNGKVVGFHIHAFQLDKIKDEFLFKIVESPRSNIFYATDNFKKIIDENGLTGLMFTEIWDSEKH